jgi:hypothetical protein
MYYYYLPNNHYNIGFDLRRQKTSSLYFLNGFIDKYWLIIIPMEREICIQVLRASNWKYARISDVIIVMVKEVIMNMPLKKS